MPTYTPPAHAHQLYLNQLARYLRDSRLIHARWAIYAHEHCDPDTGRPDDEVAYARRQVQRDADLLSAFGAVFYHADTLVDVAQQQLDQLPDSEQTRHLAGQLRQLHTNTQQLSAVHRRWIDRRDALPDGAGGKAHEALLAESYSEARPHLDQWTDHGQAVLDVNAVAREQLGPQTAPPAATREDQLNAAPATPPPAPRAASPTGRIR
ncbi:hypothetical protein [Streptomyces alboflavus]|uniref:hypothetical protein n=1 Tax=Streptomyces alboflavus TaxID=67267 RepID=UPI0007C58DE7|nr:hypothetical protein [Streptomyces alboflavus]